MKKSLLISLLILSMTIFTGCFGGDDETATEETSQDQADTQPSDLIYDATDFSITIHKDWEIIEPDSFTSNVPLETLVGFRNNIKNEAFTSNINVAKFSVNENVSSLDLSKSTLAKAKQSLIGFNQISSENITIPDEIDAVIADYEGKKSASEAVVHFKQLYAVQGQNAFIVTAAYLPDESESTLTLIDRMLESFRLK